LIFGRSLASSRIIIQIPEEAELMKITDVNNKFSVSQFSFFIEMKAGDLCGS